MFGRWFGDRGDHGIDHEGLRGYLATAVCLVAVVWVS